MNPDPDLESHHKRGQNQGDQLATYIVRFLHEVTIRRNGDPRMYKYPEGNPDASARCEE